MVSMLRKLFGRLGGGGDRAPQGGTAGEYVYEIENRETGETEFYLSFIPPEQIFGKDTPGVAFLGKLTDGPGKIDAEHFLPNKEFIGFFHDVTARHIGDCPDLIAMARRQGNGGMYMIDPRTPTPHGEVPDEDISGAVKVRDGHMVAYHGNPNFQVFTVNGLMSLSPWWRERFVEEIERILEKDA